MGLEYPCHRCGSQIHISEPKYGIKYRCPRCRAKVKFKARAQDQIEVPFVLEEVRPHPALRFMIAALILAIVGVAGVSYYGYSLNRKKADEYHRLEMLSLQQISVARRQAKSYQFLDIGATLSRAESDINQSSLLNQQNKETLLDKLVVVRGEMKIAERDYERMLQEGYRVVDGRLVGADEWAQAAAEQERREDAERMRSEAESRARAEAEEKESALSEAERRASEEQQRRSLENEESQRELREALSTLPPIEDVLNGFDYTLLRTRMASALISRRLAEIDPSRPFRLREFTASKDEFLQSFVQPETDKSILAQAYRHEIVDCITSLGFSAYLKSENETMPGGVQFAMYRERPVVLVGIVYSDTMFNSADPAKNTPKKRAAVFTRQNVLPAFSKCRPSERLKSASLDYLGIVFAYAGKNFSKSDDRPAAEFLTVVMPTKDFVAYARRDITREELLRNSAGYLATGTEKFVSIELTLD